MAPALLVIAQSDPARLSDTARWWEIGLLSINVLGAFAAVVAMLIALVWFKPKLREWRWAFVARVFAWRWVYLKAGRLDLENVRVRDRVADRLLFRFSHWIAPRPWRMTAEDEEAWNTNLNAGVEEYWRRDDVRQRHREERRHRRRLRRKWCADCGERCNAGGVLNDDGSAVCGDCRLQRRAAETGTRWERYNDGSGFGIRRVPLEPSETDADASNT